MQPLADFRIENDSVVLLSFVGGTSYRVNPKDLEQYLQKDDLVKVQHALKLRKHFMRRILPPTAMFVMGLGIIALGNYDLHRMINQNGTVASHRVAPAKLTTSPVIDLPNPQLSQPAGVNLFDSTSDGAASGSLTQPRSAVMYHNGSDSAAEHAAGPSFRIQGESGSDGSQTENATKNLQNDVQKIPGSLLH